MVGMQVVVVSCDAMGNVDVDDLKVKIHEHADNLAALMITYPSTHGVFETAVTDICAMVHDAGGQVYVDGANLNALVGLAQPGKFGADVSHLNLHKTFASPTVVEDPASDPWVCERISRRSYLRIQCTLSAVPSVVATQTVALVRCLVRRGAVRVCCRFRGPTCVSWALTDLSARLKLLS